MGAFALKAGSFAFGVQTLPLPPTNLLASATGLTTVALAWTVPVTGTAPTGYRIERSVDGGATWSQAGTNLAADVTSFSDGGLSPGVTYTYRMFSIGAAFLSSASNTSSATTDSLPVPVASFTGVPLLIQAGSSVAFTNASENYTSSSWNFGDGGTSVEDSPTYQYATAGTYTVTLTVTGPGGSDTQTRIGYITVTTVPVSPNLSSATVGSNGARWTLVFDATVTGHTGFTFRNGAGTTLSASYVSGEGTTTLLFDVATVYRGDTPTLGYSPGDVQHNTTPLSPFSGFNVTNNSTQSVAPPTQPTRSSASIDVTGSTYTAVFSVAVTGGTGITLAASGGAVTATYQSGAGTTTLVFGLSRTVLQSETVLDSYASGTIVASSGGVPLTAFTNQSVTNDSTQTAPAPGQPTNLVLYAAGDTEAVVTWTLADANDTTVTVQRSPDGSTGWATAATLAGGTKGFVDRSLWPVTTYHYRVRASNETGDSAWSASASLTTRASTARNTLAAFSVTKVNAWEVDIAWTMPATVSGQALDLIVERSEDGGETYRKVKVYVSAANLSYVWRDGPLRPSTSYTYRVRQMGNGSYSDYRGPSTVTTDAIPSGFPDVPMGLTATVLSTTQTLLTWSNEDPSAVYKIETAPIPGTQVAKDAIYSQIATTAAGASSYTLTTTALTPVFVRVRAAIGSNNSAYEYVRSPKDNLYIVPVRPCSAGTAQNYEVGPGKPYANMTALYAALGTAGPGPGSTITVYPATYNEKFLIWWRGRPDARITVIGVRDGSGNRPVFEFQNATTAGYPLANGYTFEKLGGITFHRLNANPSGHTPGYVTVSGIEIRHSGATPGTFTAADGTTQNYPVNATEYPSGFYVVGGDSITFDDCVIRLVANGVFAADNGTVQRQVWDLAITRNHIYDCGNPGSFLEHGTYTECQGELIEANRFGPQRAAGPGGTPKAGGGSMLKSRGVGVIVRYNTFGDGGNVLPVGFVEHQNSRYTAWIAPQHLQNVYGYGNTINNPGKSVTPLRFGGDQGFSGALRKGDLFWTHNTTYEKFNSASRTTWFDVYDATRLVHAINNVRYISSAGGSTPGNVIFQSNFNPVEAAGCFYSGWASPNIKDTWAGAAFAGIKQGFDTVFVTTTNTPEFVDQSQLNLKILGGSEADGLGVRLPLDHPPVNREYTDQDTQARAVWGAGSTLGAYAGAPDTTAPIVNTAVIDEFGANLVVTFSEKVTTTAAGWSVSASGGAVAIVGVSGSGTATVTFALNRVVVASETVARSYNSATGDCYDMAPTPNPLASFTGASVTNNSQETVSVGVAFRGATTSAPTSAVSSVTLTKPSAATDGDVFQVGVYVTGATTAVTPPSGWSLIPAGAQADGFGGGRLFIYTKPIPTASAEPDSYTFTFSATVFTMAALMRIVLADTASPVEASARASGTTTSTSMASPSVTTLGADRMIARWLAVDRDTAVTVPTGHFQKLNLQAQLQYGGRLVVAATTQASAGASGTANFTVASGRPPAMVTAAIKPA